MKRQTGFTLIELMVTVTIAVVLASIAVPSFQSLMARQSVDAVADTLASDMRFARAEAVKRANGVTICASTNGTSCTGNGGLWKDGWIVFVDFDSDGMVDSADSDAVVRVQSKWPLIASIAASDGSSLAQFKFFSSGSARGSAQTFVITPTGSNTAGLTRVVCVSIQGRASVKTRGSTSC